jgi:cytochrome c
MKSRTIYLGITAAVVFFLSACTGQVSRVPEPLAVSDQSIAKGRRLIASYGCGSCHSIPGIPGADATVAPPLDRFYERHYIAGRLWNTPENLAEWIQNPQAVKPGTGMPNLGVREDEARDMAAYLYHLPSLSNLIGR